MNVWALVPVGILGAGLSGLLALASIASKDPGFALEPNYYGKAVGWEGQQAQWADNQRLGWSVELATGSDGSSIVARVELGDGTALSNADVRAEVFANARAADRREIVFAERAAGSYEAKLPAGHGGLWEIRITIRRNGERFTHVDRVDLPGAGGHS